MVSQPWYARCSPPHSHSLSNTAERIRRGGLDSDQTRHAAPPIIALVGNKWVPIFSFLVGGGPLVPPGYYFLLLADSQLFVFGGFTGHNILDDVHMLDLAAVAYLPQVTGFSIDSQ